jgi:hypothetical protein
MTEPKVIPILPVDDVQPPRCADFDDDCPGVQDKVKCWLYAPEEGYCPYLRQ